MPPSCQLGVEEQIIVIKLSTFHFVRVAQHKRNIMLIKILTSQYIGSPLSNVMSKVCIYTARNIYVQGLTFGPFKTKLDAAPFKSHHITNLLFFFKKKLKFDQLRLLLFIYLQKIASMIPF